MAENDLVLAALALAIMRRNDATEASVCARGRRIELAAVDDLTVRELLSLVTERATPVHDTTRFDRAELRIAARLLRELAARPDARVCELDGVGDRERHVVTRASNDVPRTERATMWIADAFAEQALRTPAAVAVVDGVRRVTYADLDRQTSLLAARLKEAGAGPGRVVAIAADRSVELVAAIVATLRAGAAFLPLGTDEPPERAGRKLWETEAVAMVAGNGELTRLRTAPAAFPADLAYVMYTSGSTGEPKGALLTQQALADLCVWYRREYAIGEGTNVLLMIPATFDASLKNILTPLVSGARLVLAPPRYNPLEVVELIDRERITLINCAPSAIYPVVQLAAREGYRRLSSLRALALGGEAMRLAPLREWLLRDGCACVLSNLYGPAECTDLAIGGPVDRETLRTADAPPLGRAIVHAKICILDRRGRPQPRGACGEIWIGGPGVGLGYAARPELTAASFIGGMYRSGDYGWWRGDGQIEFAGRRDHQIKVRGRRIDLGEIERHLLAVPGVREAAVVRHDDGRGGAVLRAFYESEVVIESAVLARRLRELLPDWMVPLSFTRRDRIPLNSNGKVDRRVLASHEVTNTQQSV